MATAAWASRTLSRLLAAAFAMRHEATVLEAADAFVNRRCKRNCLYSAFFATSLSLCLRISATSRLARYPRAAAAARVTPVAVDSPDRRGFAKFRHLQLDEKQDWRGNAEIG